MFQISAFQRFAASAPTLGGSRLTPSRLGTKEVGTTKHTEHTKADFDSGLMTRCARVSDPALRSTEGLQAQEHTKARFDSGQRRPAPARRRLRVQVSAFQRFRSLSQSAPSHGGELEPRNTRNTRKPNLTQDSGPRTQDPSCCGTLDLGPLDFGLRWFDVGAASRRDLDR